MAENSENKGVVKKIDALKTMLAAPSVQEQFENALKENSGTFVASVIDLFNGDSYLQACDPKLVVMEALKAAILKLPINKSLGFAYIVPYKKNGVSVPQFQIGYKGLIQLAMRTGQYRIINADVVLEGEYRSKNKLTGEYDLNGNAKSETIIGYFAHFEMLNGFSKTLYMTKDRVIAHAQKYSKSYGNANGPWKTEFDAMAIKTVLRGLLGHWGMLSTEMISNMNDDEDVADTAQQEINAKGNNREKEMSFDGVQEAEFAEEGEGGPGF
jgi:recombination protein RecT